jgi:hypothetical protein
MCNVQAGIEKLNELEAEGTELPSPTWYELRCILESVRDGKDELEARVRALEAKEIMCTCPDHKEPHIHHVPKEAKPSECKHEWTEQAQTYAHPKFYCKKCCASIDVKSTIAELKEDLKQRVAQVHWKCVEIQRIDAENEELRINRDYHKEMHDELRTLKLEGDVKKAMELLQRCLDTVNGSLQDETDEFLKGQTNV